MTVQAPVKTGLQLWQDGINKAPGDARWNAWDCEVQMAVNEYNRHLSATPGFWPLDWQLIKAILWVETGALVSEWKIKPMQIGVAGDPGMTSLLSHKEGGDLIIPPSLKGKLTPVSIRSIPALNIRAGIGYLLMRMAHFEYRSLLSTDTQTCEAVVRAGDSFEKVAKAHGTTVDMLRTLNPTSAVLRPGQVLKYQKASIQKVITGWKSFSTLTVALQYNSMRRDVNYAKKLDHALSLIRKGEAGRCAP